MNIAIVAIVIPQIKKLSVVNTDEYGNDDYSIIKAVEKKVLLKNFELKLLINYQQVFE